MIRARILLRAGDFLLDARWEAPERGVTALFGPSGCGKTSLLRCVAGLEPGARGNLYFGEQVWQDDGAGIFRPAHLRPIGYVFQESSLFPHLDVGGNLAFGYARVPAAERRINWEQAIEWLGVEPLLNRMPARLSGGERQRVELARAILSSPRLLLLDEPLAGLDRARRREILPLLEQLNETLHIPIIHVSHEIEEIARLADHVIVLEQGRVIAAGPANEVLEHETIATTPRP
jgi:molybdate transport system ATP-binding protein